MLCINLNVYLYSFSEITMYDTGVIRYPEI